MKSKEERLLHAIITVGSLLSIIISDHLDDAGQWVHKYKHISDDIIETSVKYFPESCIMDHIIGMLP